MQVGTALSNSILDNDPIKKTAFFFNIVSSVPNLLQYLEPQHKIGLMSMWITSGKLERYDEAIKYFDQSISLDPNSTKALINKFIILLKQNKIDYALDVIKTVVRNGFLHALYVLWRRLGVGRICILKYVLE